MRKFTTSVPNEPPLGPSCRKTSDRCPAIGTCLIAVIAAAATIFAQPALAVKINLERPGDREFVRDLANLVDDEDEQAIETLADKLLTEHATPIIVVTIESMAKHGGDGMRIETFARFLFDQWEIGVKEINGQNWNTGILLLVSKGDRKARIELGAGWKRDKDDDAQRIMDQQIIPMFKAGQFSDGIMSGTQGLDALARGKALPKAASPPRPASHYLIGLAFIGLAVFTAISLIRRGASGWAWLFWGVVFSVVGTILYHLATSRGGSGGGGFSGGSFGGGFSGGGGASGSW